MATFALDLSYETIPERAVREAKRFLLDSLGCALAALPGEDVQAMLRVTRSLGGTAEATILGTEERTNAPNAALMNSLLIRALDYNDIYWAQDPSHPSDLIGAVLASAEANARTCTETLTAIVLAYELNLRWCHVATPGIYTRGWHHATLTQFVSPLVAGKLYGLDLDQMVAAVGIGGAAQFTSGEVAVGELTNMKNTVDPLAVQRGVVAALMAREGYTGPAEIIEGGSGLVNVVSNVDWNTRELVKNLGREFLITRCGYKAYPTEALTQGPITAMIELRERHGIRHTEIEEILVETVEQNVKIHADPSKYRPDTKETADHSLPYVIAVAAVDGQVLPDSFAEQKLFDPHVRALLPKIRVVASADIETLFPAVKRARVHVRLVNGTTFVEEVDVAKGDPGNPMSDEELASKFRANAAISLTDDGVDEALGACESFESFNSVEDFMRLVASKRRA